LQKTKGPGPPALLAEGGGDGREVWWSTELFPERDSIAPATRSKGRSNSAVCSLSVGDSSLSHLDRTRSPVKALGTSISL